MIVNLVVTTYLRRMALRGKSLPTVLSIDNLVWGQPSDKHKGVDKPPFLPLSKSIFDPLLSDYWVKLQSTWVE